MKKSIQKVGMRVTLQCNDYTLHEGSIIASFCCKNDFLFRGWGAGKKEKFSKKYIFVLLGEKNNKVAKNILFWRKRWRKK